LSDQIIDRKKTMIIFTSHPIQYQSPWFRVLAGHLNLDVHVAYVFAPDRATQGEGFGVPFAWDIPLREGFSNEVLHADAGASLVTSFLRVRDVLRARRPDVALILGWHHRSLMATIACCRLRGIPIILRGESNLHTPRAPWKGLVHRALFTCADSVLTIGAANAEHYVRRGVPAQRMATARYFVDNSRFQSSAADLAPHREALRAKWGIEPDRFCLLFVGKLEPKKRVMDVLAAVRRLLIDGRKVHVLIVGDGEQRSEAEAYIKSTGLAATMAGFMNQSEISRAYAAADALVLPSDFGETWGLVCNEAMASGIPAIVSERVGCASDLVIHGITGGVSRFGEVDDIARVAAEWIDDPEYYQKVRSNAISHIRAYSIEAAVRGLEDAVSIALESSGAAER
jgi:glycosyltransferase involved in cell wall biosynthesis